MSSINLKVLKQLPTEIQTSVDQPLVPTTPFTYSDILLDLAIAGKDIAVGYDVNAVKTSIENLFNSNPGQWILNPTLGIGLPHFLFRAVDEHTGKQIADTIITNLTTFEPRIRIQKLTVLGDPDNNLYEITLAIQLANVNNSTIMLNGTLDSAKFQFTN